VPTRSGSNIARPHLTSRLVGPAQITVLSAPSGFGKTTLLKEWVNAGAAGDAPLLWVSLTEQLSGPTDLWRMIAQAAGRAGLLTDADGMLQRLAAGHDPVDLMRQVLQPVAEPVYVLIDAFERAGSATAEFEQAAVRLAAQFPVLHIVLATRGGSTLTAPAMRLRSGIEVLDAADLGFSLAEASELLDGSGLDAAALHRETSGYPLALRAAMLGGSLALHAESRPWAHIAAEALLSTLPAEQRAFVRDTVLPPYFDLGLAAVLSGLPDPLPVVTALETQGLGRWVPFEPDNPVFQYVDGVREVLTHGTPAVPLHERHHEAAARWLCDHGDLGPALRLALAGKQYDLATDVLCRMLLLDASSYSSPMLLEYLDGVPSEELAAYPMLAFGLGVGLIPNRATRALAAQYLAIAAQPPQRPMDGTEFPGTDLFIRVVSLRILGKYAASAAVAREAVAWLTALPDHPGPYRHEARAASLRHHAYSLFQGGDVEAARTAVEHAIGFAEQPWSRNYTYVYSVGFNALEGRRLSAADAAALVDESAWPPGQTFTYVNALGRIGQATSLLDDFRFAEALATYERCEFLVNGEVWPFVSWTMLHAHLGLGTGGAEARRLMELIDSPVPPPGLGANLGSAMLRNALAVAWLAEGQPGRAAALTTDDSPFAGQLAPARMLARLIDGRYDDGLAELSRLRRLPGHTLRSRAGLSTLAAATALHAGDDKLARLLLGEAASIFDVYGTRAHLAVVPAADLVALRELAGTDPALAGYLDAPTDGTVYPLAVALSEREREVMRVLIRARTRDAAAAELHVSVNTMKAHLKSIYRKLDAASRRQAVTRFLELELHP
jgi:LuxR family maltose regulon positive regulatory protein